MSKKKIEEHIIWNMFSSPQARDLVKDSFPEGAAVEDWVEQQSSLSFEQLKEKHGDLAEELARVFKALAEMRVFFQI